MQTAKNAHRRYVEKPLGKYPLGRTRRRWEDNTFIMMYIREMGCEAVRCTN
jgi:hypothetical protein